jgi:hypothetical protein
MGQSPAISPDAGFLIALTGSVVLFLLAVLWFKLSSVIQNASYRYMTRLISGFRSWFRRYDAEGCPGQHDSKGWQHAYPQYAVAQALMQAGISRAAWSVIDRTGDPLFEELLTGQLTRNGLDSTGIPSVAPNR